MEALSCGINYPLISMVDMPTNSVMDMFSSLRRELHLIMGQELKNSEFGHKQMSILYHLGGRGELSMGELALLTLSDKATVTRAVDALEKCGLVKRASDAKDSRKTVLKLTAKGKTHAGRAQKLRDVLAQKMDACLSPNEQKQLTDLLAKVVNGLKDRRAESEI